MCKLLHYVSKYNLILLVYSIFLGITFTFINASYFTFILTTLIYIILINKKILVFSSSWIKEDN